MFFFNNRKVNAMTSEYFEFFAGQLNRYATCDHIVVFEREC